MRLANVEEHKLPQVDYSLAACSYKYYPLKLGGLRMHPIEVRELVKTFGNIIAVNKLTFDVHEGEVYGLLGPNGAGKTTTLKVLMGLLDPDSGTANVFGINSIYDPIEVKKRVGYVPEEQLLYNSLTSREILEFVASVRGLDYYHTKNRVAEMARALDFTTHYDKPIVTLSQGNKQKAMLLIAMLHAPDLLILDEPFSGLDVGNIRDVKRSFDLIQKDHELNTIIYSTHELRLAVELADSIYVVGYPTIDGVKQNYATIVKHYDLKAMGMAWTEFGQEHIKLITEIDATMMVS